MGMEVVWHATFVYLFLVFESRLIFHFCFLSNFHLSVERIGSSALTSLLVLSPQDENSSGCSQKADYLQRMLSREQQELQVCITITRS